MTSGYQVRIRRRIVDDDGLRIDMGTPEPGLAWWDLPLPPCPDCGGDLVWFEAGYVPGTRRCMGSARADGSYAETAGCGSLFSVQCQHGQVWLRRERLY